MQETNLTEIVPKRNSILGSGKMLRAQLTLTVGAATGAPEQDLIHAAAAVEIIHAASLLHDDVIDGGLLRRGAPTFWKKHGINGAILLGDLLVLKAMQLLSERSRPDLLKELIDLSTLVCISEVEQELVLRGAPGTWEDCEQIARRKTGSLFAFAAYAAGTNPTESTALREAGFLIGTAYQLVDDILDASDNEEISGKTLGKDAERGKTTALTALKHAPADPHAYIKTLCNRSANLLKEHPNTLTAWNLYIDKILKKVMDKHLHAAH
jgi:geranylgeranyl pyrophosphate synthase